MKKCIALISLLFTATSSIAQTEGQQLPEGPYMYVYLGQTCDAYDCQHFESCLFSDSLVEVELNHIYRVSEFDSLNFRRPTLPIKKAGWTGDVENGESYYYPLKYCYNYNKVEYAMRFQAHNGICQKAELLWNSRR